MNLHRTCYVEKGTTRYLSLSYCLLNLLFHLRSLNFYYRGPYLPVTNIYAESCVFLRHNDCTACGGGIVTAAQIFV